MDIKELIEQAKSHLEGVSEDCFEDCLSVVNTAYNIARADLYLDFALKELEKKATEVSHD